MKESRFIVNCKTPIMKLTWSWMNVYKVTHYMLWLRSACILRTHTHTHTEWALIEILRLLFRLIHCSLPLFSCMWRSSKISCVCFWAAWHGFGCVRHQFVFFNCINNCNFCTHWHTFTGFSWTAAEKNAIQLSQFIALNRVARIEVHSRICFVSFCFFMVN